MGNIGDGRNLEGYQSPESRRIAALDRRLADLDSRLAVIEQLLVTAAGESPDREVVQRSILGVTARTQERAESTRRMMEALAGVTKEATS
jgi:hypothetical protein